MMQAAETERRCAQCWKVKPIADFEGTKGLVRRCARCREAYGRWATMTTAEKLAIKRRPFNATGALRVTLNLRSNNVKVGPIPVSMTGRGSCPDACTLKNNGCYAEYHVMRMHWGRVPTRGLSWSAFCAAISALPTGQLWRHNEAGDLPGENDRIDPVALDLLVFANTGRRGFTFTHKPVFGRGAQPALNRMAIARANRRGFVVNLSADSLADADRLAELGIGPVAVVLPEAHPDRASRTPAGRKVVVCPAQTRHLTCADCQLCAVPDRKSIIGFRAHGQFKAHVSELVQLGRKR
jgi:hypothetical protein